MSEHNVLERNAEAFHGVESPRSDSDLREPAASSTRRMSPRGPGSRMKIRLPERPPQPIRQNQFGRR